MSEDVRIPAHKAKHAAHILRAVADPLNRSVVAPADMLGLADILDPPALTLREKVAQALLDVPNHWPSGRGYVPDDEESARQHADAVLAAIADEIAALPYEVKVREGGYASDVLDRGDVLDRLRGES